MVLQVKMVKFGILELLIMGFSQTMWSKSLKAEEEHIWY
jgi:hypothetical protein